MKQPTRLLSVRFSIARSLCVLCVAIGVLGTARNRGDGRSDGAPRRQGSDGCRPSAGQREDGGLLLLGRDGVLWLLPPEEQAGHTSDATPFTPLGRDDLTKCVLSQLPQGFDVHSTRHYLIFHDTSAVYAQWCGSLFEDLYKIFNNYWTKKGFKLTEPEFPLVAVVFADKRSYQKFARPELGEAGESIVGYFSLMSNRMTMYDLSGVESQGHNRGHVKTSAQINEILSQPEAQRTVSTIVHEATHQIAFNCGLHARLSDCPRWFSEGIAMFFETPNLGDRKGWSKVGEVNRPRLEEFQKYLPGRPSNSLEMLICDDKEFLDTKTALDAYSEAWALTYFLLRQHAKEYVAYLGVLSQKKPLGQDGPEKRLEEFRQAFGDPRALDNEFLRDMSKIR